MAEGELEQEFSISHSSEGVARFQVGCSARHDDFQHTCPLKTTSQTLEMMALQTKVVSAFQIKKSPWDRYSFTGHDWWSPLLAYWKKLAPTRCLRGNAPHCQRTAQRSLLAQGMPSR